ncbi:MAG: methionyl-tRNA formyltransferase [Dehalococcoidales bacterium]
MRIVLIGQAAFGEKVLQTLVDRGEEVVGVYTAPDIPGKTNPLKQLALQLGIPTFQPEDMRAPEVYDEYAKLKPDLNVMAYVTSIIPESILDYPRLGTIQYHPSLLPKHRGGSAINWAIINGETKTGITIFWPNKGIDTGPILLQKEVEISPDDTVGSLYFNKLFPLGIEAIAESIELIKKGVAPRIPQNESQATYEGLCTEKEAIINWFQPVTKIYNLIRGTNPQPGATTRFQGKGFKIFDSELLAGAAGGLPGEIIDITKEGFVVAAPEGAILVKRVQLKGLPKIGAAEFAGQTSLKIGDKLGE